MSEGRSQETWNKWEENRFSQSVFELNSTWARIGEAERARRRASVAERGRFSHGRLMPMS